MMRWTNSAESAIKNAKEGQLIFKDWVILNNNNKIFYI